MVHSTNDEDSSDKVVGSQEIKPASLSDPENVSTDVEVGETNAFAIPTYMITNKWQRLANKLEVSSGVEARGIERVNESLRMGRNTLRDYFKMTEIWFSVNLTVSDFLITNLYDI
jgi:hypothetical protein